jgi:hypothetical protein
VSPITGWCGLVISLTGILAVTETEILSRRSEKNIPLRPVSRECDVILHKVTVRRRALCPAATPLTGRSSHFGCRDYLVNTFATNLRIWRVLLHPQLEDAPFLDNKGRIYLYLKVILYFPAEDSRSPEVGIRNYFFTMAQEPQWSKAFSSSRIHDHPQLDTPHSVGLFSTSD